MSSNNLQVLSSSAPNFQPILDKALEEYKKKTGRDLDTHPLAREIKSCASPEDILTLLQGKADELNQSRTRSSDERLTKWLAPTVNVLNILSTTLGEGVSTAFPPTKIIFSGIGVLLIAAKDTAMSREVLIKLFEKIEKFFARLQTYTENTQTAQMTNVIGKVMAEVLSILAIATKMMKQGRKKTFLQKLVGRNDIEDALQKFDELEREELITVTAQMSKTTNDLMAAASNIKDDTEETNLMVRQIVSDMSSRDWERLLQDLRQWLTPPDPSTNHNIACSAQHERTATWIFNEVVFKEWELSGSLLWIHGKPGSGKSIICSAIIQHILALREVRLATVAYFYFDFRDTNKKHRRNLLCSLLIQLSAHSAPCNEILHRIYLTHEKGAQQPSDDTLKNCLKEMLSVASAQCPVYIIMDAVDECPDTSGVPPPRQQVLSLVKDLVDLHLSNLHICVTSRPEVDIRNTLEPLTSRRISLHDQPGQKKDIVDYVSSVVHSDVKMRKWREDDRKLVIETLSEKVDGMFRWVFCQLEVLRHCLAPSLRRQLNELPKGLDETYERVLKEIESTGQGRYARRLLRCVAMALRPLRVEELAEVLAVELDAAEGEIPTIHAGWRWEDQEQAVLSACSSLIAVVDDDDDSRVIQFSHFSVKEFLTSDRLAASSGYVSQYYIHSEPAHLILARACLGVLLSPDNRVNEESEEGSSVGNDKYRMRVKNMPLLNYAAEHWASHAQVGNVSSSLKDAMETLFDSKKPYFLAWTRIHDIDRDLNASRYSFYGRTDTREAQPLYYAARCGFYDLVRRLIVKHPEQLNWRSGTHSSPLVAALSCKHIRVAELLLEHGADVHVRGDPPLCRAIAFKDGDARVKAVRFLLGHGADVNAGYESLCTPLHMAADVGAPEVARILLEHGADANLRDNYGQVPLHLVSINHYGEHSIVARLLLDHCTDVNVQDMHGATPLHCASIHGRLEISQLLLRHGANAHTEDVNGRNPLHELLRGVCDTGLTHGESGVDLQNVLSIAQLLLEHGVDVNALDKDNATPLHFASSCGLEVVQLLLAHGAKANVENLQGQTPLHLVPWGQLSFPAQDTPNIVQLFLKLGINVNARDKDQATPLHFACFRGNFEAVQALLDHGAEADAQNADGRTPLHRVSQHSHGLFRENNDTRIQRLLLERGVDVNAQDKDQETPLHLACSCGSYINALVLLDHGADVSAQNADGQTPFHQVRSLLSWADPLENPHRLAQLFLDRGVDVNARDKHQATPLHLASYWSDSVFVRMLLEHGAEANAQNADGQIPLHQVSQGSQYDDDKHQDSSVARLLLEGGMGVHARDKDQATPLHLASYYGRAIFAEVLLDHGAQANAKDIRGQTPLHQVLLGNHDYQSYEPSHDYQGFPMEPWHRKSHSIRVLRIVRRLLEHGADVNAQNKDQETPLHLASHFRLHKMARVLLKHGADVNARNKDQETPLHLASRLRLHEMARILLKHGADVNAKNSEGKSPLQLATGRKGKAMKRLLSEYSANAA